MATCGQCEKHFKSLEGYLDHECKKTGYKPTQAENLGEDFKAISEAALQRGNKRAELEDAGKSPKEAVKETRDLGKTVV